MSGYKEDNQAIQELLLRGVALTYLAAIASLLWQLDGLIGENGILPAGRYLDSAYEQVGAAALWYLPSLFWLNAGTGFMLFVGVVALAVCVTAFFNYWRLASLVFLWIVYLSFCSVGQTFFSFQWDILLVECGFLAILLAWRRDWIMLWLFRVLVFRLMFSAGMVKLLSGDAAWHNLTALDYHYFTQPLPNPLSWFFHQLPAWFQKVSTFIMFVIELGVPFLIFLGRWPRRIAFFSFVFLQVLIIASGNYTFFSYLALVLAIVVLDDADLPAGLRAALGRAPRLRSVTVGRWSLGSSPTSAARAESRAALKPAYAIAAFILLLGLAQQALTLRIIDHRSKIGASVQAISPLRLVNRYGLFAVMTKQRHEIIIEGSYDQTTWKEYEFKHKPGSVDRIPSQVAPHQPRIDWQMWFAALGTYERNPWLVRLMLRLLQGEKSVLGLIEGNPFERKPPLFLRAQLFDYTFSDKAGLWWDRRFLKAYTPVLTLQGFLQ